MQFTKDSLPDLVREEFNENEKFLENQKINFRVNLLKNMKNSRFKSYYKA